MNFFFDIRFLTFVEANKNGMVYFIANSSITITIIHTVRELNKALNLNNTLWHVHSAAVNNHKATNQNTLATT